MPPGRQRNIRKRKVDDAEEEEGAEDPVAVRCVHALVRQSSNSVAPRTCGMSATCHQPAVPILTERPKHAHYFPRHRRERVEAAKLLQRQRARPMVGHWCPCVSHISQRRSIAWLRGTFTWLHLGMQGMDAAALAVQKDTLSSVSVII